MLLFCSRDMKLAWKVPYFCNVGLSMKNYLRNHAFIVLDAVDTFKL